MEQDMINFDTLNEYLKSNAFSVLQEICPGGKLIGHEYTAGSKFGDRGDSFKYNISKMTGADFATNDNFGDIISLFASIKNIKQIESATLLAEKYCPSAIEKPKTNYSSTRPNLNHTELGVPTKSWVYLSKEGRPVLYVARYDPKGRKKTYKPWRFNGTSWECKNIENDRPLYNLPAVIKAKTVVLCEGEKAADACQEIFCDDAVCTTWPGGAQAIDKADFSVIKDKNVIIWPDADKAGIKAGEKLVKILLPLCKSVKVVDISEFPDKYDAYDFISDSKSKEDLIIKDPYNKQELVATITEYHNKADLWRKLNLDLSSNEKPYGNADNVSRILSLMPSLKGQIWFDEFHNKIFTTWESNNIKEWSDLKTVDMMIFIQRIVGISKLGKESVLDAVVHYANKDIRNEPQDWIKSIKWDGIERIDTFFNKAAGSPESAYSKSLSRNFWISLVARIFNPGCKVDNMIILEGAQGSFKSTMFEKIGGKLYSEASTDIRSVEFYKCLEAKIIVEFAELSSFSKTEINIIKKMITCKSDRYRASYHRFASDHPRTCIFTGSTNDEVYLNDPTGARRFWPLETNIIEIPYIVDNRSQLFAEAYCKYKNSMSWWETPEEETKLEQENRRVNDAWENIVIDFIRTKDFITIVDVAQKLGLRNDQIDKSVQMRIASIIKVSKMFKKSKITENSGFQKRGWEKIKKDDEKTKESDEITHKIDEKENEAYEEWV